jgi:hypothetical protein
MKAATLALGVLILAAPGLVPAETAAGLPDGKIAIVRATAVDGLARHGAPRTETRSAVFSYDGTEYSIDRSVLTSLDGVQTLLLIDRRKDELTGGSLVRHHSQEVRAFNGTAFEVKDLKDRVLGYQVAMIGGNLRLLGGGDQILARGGAGSPYQVWRIDRIDLADREAVVLR